MLKQTPDGCKLRNPRKWERFGKKVCGLLNAWTIHGNDLTGLVLLLQVVGVHPQVAGSPGPVANSDGQCRLRVSQAEGFFLERCGQTCFFERCGQTLFQFDLQQAIGEVLFPGFRVCSKL